MTGRSTDGDLFMDAMEIDLDAGRVAVASRNIERNVPPLPAAGGLIPFLKAHPDWRQSLSD